MPAKLKPRLMECFDWLEGASPAKAKSGLAASFIFRKTLPHSEWVLHFLAEATGLQTTSGQYRRLRLMAR